MKILNLYAGIGGNRKLWGDEHEITAVEFDPKIAEIYKDYFPNDTVIVGDAHQYLLDHFKEFDFIWSSPPCPGFSVAALGHHWTGGKGAYIPKTDTAKLGIEIAKKTLEIINHYKPKYFFIENPRGLLRKMPFMQDLKRHTVTYCQYGDKRMKPTDIWTNSENWKPRPMCKNGSPCHEAAPRGSKTGTQGLKNDFERSKIPVELCREIILSCI